MKTFKLFTALTLLILLQGVCGDTDADTINVSGLNGKEIKSLKVQWSKVKGDNTNTVTNRVVYEVVDCPLSIKVDTSNTMLTLTRKCEGKNFCIQLEGMMHIRAKISKVTFVTVDEKSFTLNPETHETWLPRCTSNSESDPIQNFGLVYPAEDTEISAYLYHIPFQFNRTFTFDDFNRCEMDEANWYTRT